MGAATPRRVSDAPEPQDACTCEGQPLHQHPGQCLLQQFDARADFVDGSGGAGEAWGRAELPPCGSRLARCPVEDECDAGLAAWGGGLAYSDEPLALLAAAFGACPAGADGPAQLILPPAAADAWGALEMSHDCSPRMRDEPRC